MLALVGGRSYNQSQYNRAISASRQPGSVFKPFVYLAAFERAAAEGRTDLTPATLVDDEPTTFTTGRIERVDAQQLRERVRRRSSRCGARWRSRATSATIKVAETAGFDKVAALWTAIGVGTNAHAYPSITLGVFEATPIEIATAYTLFPNGGQIRPLRVLSRVVTRRQDDRAGGSAAARRSRAPTRRSSSST